MTGYQISRNDFPKTGRKSGKKLGSHFYSGEKDVNFQYYKEFTYYNVHDTLLHLA